MRYIGRSFSLGRSLFFASVIQFMWASRGADQMYISLNNQAENTYQTVVCNVADWRAYFLNVEYPEVVVRCPTCSCETRRMKITKAQMNRRPVRMPTQLNGNQDQNTVKNLVKSCRRSQLTYGSSTVPESRLPRSTAARGLPKLLKNVYVAEESRNSSMLVSLELAPS